MDNTFKSASNLFKENTFVQIGVIALVFFLIYKFVIKKEGFEGLLPDNIESVKFVSEPKVVPVPVVEAPPLPLGNNIEDKLLNSIPEYEQSNNFDKENAVSKLLKKKNFLIGGYHNSRVVTQTSKKLGDYNDLRSIPAIPKQTVGPWSQSSMYEPIGAGRRFLEIGQ